MPPLPPSSNFTVLKASGALPKKKKKNLRISDLFYET